MTNFTKSDLRTGDCVELRDGNRYQVMINDDFALMVNEDEYTLVSFYCEGLTHSNQDFEGWDIIKVVRPKYDHEFIFSNWGEGALMFDRKETTQMTIAEIEEKLGITNLKIIRETD